MKAWITLYAMTWIVLVEFLLAMTPGAPGWVTYAHVALGLAIVALAFVNLRGVRATTIAGRVKRTAQSTAQLSVAMAALGALLLFGVGKTWALLGVSLWGVILFLHVVVGFAIITQAAAVAIAFDMWEEKEFAEETTPGEVPAMPGAPSAPRRLTRGSRRT